MTFYTGGENCNKFKLVQINFQICQIDDLKWPGPSPQKSAPLKGEWDTQSLLGFAACRDSNLSCLHTVFTWIDAAAFISFFAIRLRRLFEGGVYSGAAFIQKSLYSVLNIVLHMLTFLLGDSNKSLHSQQNYALQKFLKENLTQEQKSTVTLN